MTAPTPYGPASIAPLFDRVIFRMLVPALVLPALAAVVAIIGTSGRPSDGDLEGPIAGLVVAVYMFVLLGSMTLNAWIILRHPASFETRALPRTLAVEQAVLYILLLAWMGLLAAGMVGAYAMVLGAALAALSTVICFSAVARRLGSKPGIALTEVPLSPMARGLGIAYVVVAALAVVGNAVAQVGGFSGSDAGGPLGGPGSWVLLVLGLPWSHPLYFGSVVLLFTVASSIGGSAYLVTPVLMSLAVIANIVLVASIVWSPTRRVALTNWFFRLKQPKPDVDALAEDAAVG